MKLRKSSTLLCALMAAVYFAGYLARLNFSTVMADLIAGGVLGKAEAGQIGSALFFAYGVGQIVSGALSDRFRPPVLIGFGIGLASLCNFLMPLVSSPLAMTVIWGANGFAQALFWPSIVHLLAFYLDEKEYSRGNWMVSVSAQAATVLIYLIVPLLLTFFSWKSAFFFGAISTAVMLVVWIFGYRKLEGHLTPMAPVSEKEASEDEKKQGGLFRGLLVSGTIVAFIAVAAQGFIKDGVQSWLPTFFNEAFSMESASAILSGVVMPVFNVTIITLGTLLYRRVIHNEMHGVILFFGIAVLCAGLLIVFRENSPVLCLLLASLITGSMHAVNLMLISFLPRRFSNMGKVATVSGLCNAASYAGSTVSSFGIAAIAENMGWEATLISWMIVLGIGLAVGILILPRYTRFLRKHP